ncbi:MAG: uracil-DNA glycosylase [Acidimicrobiia bacterium]|nr:uracil-DNA glycosylase [Acidimicrobiia bacterium]
MHPLFQLQQSITACNLCPRLREHCREVARVKRRAYLDWDYWGQPVPSFGDPGARLLIVGLAPGAHGANRTGRMFTGDSSGELLYRVLHGCGFASQPESRNASDGLTLIDAYITAAARCAPPGNKPSPAELHACRPYLHREIGLLRNVQVVVALGRIAFDAYLTVLAEANRIASKAPYTFAHNKTHRTGKADPILISSYHPSQQNTSTGRLTEAMLRAVFQRAKKLTRA